MDEPRQKTLTVPQAAAATGLSEKAIRRRIERDSLPSVLGHDRRRRVPVLALREAGLIAPPGAPMGLVPRAGHPGGEAIPELLERLERLAAENGRLRALTDGRERRERELVEQLHVARARIAETETPRRWWQRGS